MPGLRRLTVRDLLAQGRITSNALEYVRENVFTNAAALIAEGTLKPESNITFTKETANVKTIAHWIGHHARLWMTPRRCSPISTPA